MGRNQDKIQTEEDGIPRYIHHPQDSRNLNNVNLDVPKSEERELDNRYNLSGRYTDSPSSNDTTATLPRKNGS